MSEIDGAGGTNGGEERGMEQKNGVSEALPGEGEASDLKAALIKEDSSPTTYDAPRTRLGSDLEGELASASAGESVDITTRRDIIIMFIIGLINNSSFVIFAASAKEIASSSVGLVYLCASVPSFGIRISAPYWFDKVSYGHRIRIATVLMALSFTGVAVAPYQWLQLVGVMLTSAQQGLGEASFLSLCSRFGNKTLTAWSSGTGLAGLFGYAWVIVFKTWMGLPFRFVLLLANVLCVGYAIAFYMFRPPPSLTADFSNPASNEGTALGNAASSDAGGEYKRASQIEVGEPGEEKDATNGDVVKLELTFAERLRLSLSLWHITVPLIIVYMAEYAAQAGAWAAIGFPTHDKGARESFYEYANWCYQGGVFVSRSSGEFWRPGKLVLWAMGFTQCFVLIFFVLDARFKFWYDNSLLSLAFFTGLLGGAVYVNAFRLIAAAVESYRCIFFFLKK